ncbi:hypothetical protein [Moorella sp. ACPs]|uniref:hypothetical protein n=1 Tax=Neomoorella carbonis TaxID=3062783 RepID=UPI00324AC060
MDVMPWTALIFQSIPEEIILVTLGLALVDEYPRMKGIVVVGVIVAVFSFFFRHLPLGFGVHTLAGILVLGLTMLLVLRVDFFKGLMAAFLGMLALGIVEGISIPFIFYITGIPFEIAVRDPWLRVLFPLPDEILLGVAAYFCRRRRFSLLPGNRLLVKPTGREKEDEK